MLEMTRKPLAMLSMLKRLPGEKPNTAASTLWNIISLSNLDDGYIYAVMERS
jgi:hypothetical protein